MTTVVCRPSFQRCWRDTVYQSLSSHQSTIQGECILSNAFYYIVGNDQFSLLGGLVPKPISDVYESMEYYLSRSYFIINPGFALEVSDRTNAR